MDNNKNVLAAPQTFYFSEIRKWSEIPDYFYYKLCYLLPLRLGKGVQEDNQVVKAAQPQQYHEEKGEKKCQLLTDCITPFLGIGGKPFRKIG